MTDSDTQEQVRTIFCIPGHWSSRTELVQAIPGTGYLFADNTMARLDSDDVFELEVCEPDDRMVDSFRSAGRHWLTENDEQRLGEHSFVLYLVAKGGSHERAKSAMLAASALLHAGGYAVKVESAGIAHSKEGWLEFCEYLQLFSAHQALVVYVTGERTFSCGMHNLGLPDAIVAASDSTEAVELIRQFTLYMFSENPAIRSGETFSTGDDQPVYRLGLIDCELYERHDIYFNPFGMVLLEKVRD